MPRNDLVKTRICLKAKLLIYEYKEKYPYLCPEEIAEIFNLNLDRVIKLFKDEYLIVPSKFNRK
jgi:hypothetical protein